MNISPDEALAILKKFSSENCNVTAAFLSPDMALCCSLTGKLWSGGGRMAVKRGADSPDAVIFSLSACSFEYSDSREAPTPLREVLAAEFESSITVNFPGGATRLFLFEHRAE